MKRQRGNWNRWNRRWKNFRSPRRYMGGMGYSGTGSKSILGGGKRSSNPQELKVATFDIAAQNPTTSGFIVSINDIAAGTTDQTRIGNVICIKKVMMHLCIQATSTSLGQCYRVLILFDKQPNKSLPTLDDIFVGTATHNSRDFMEMDNRRRFTTVFNSHQFNVGANTNDNDNRVIEFYSDAKAESVYSDGSGGIGSQTTGSLILVYIGDKGVAANSATFQAQVRIRFTDGGYYGRPTFFNRKTHGNWLAG